MATTEPAIVVTGVELALTSATETARNRRDELLALARRGKFINSPESAQRAGALLSELKEFTRSIDASKKEAKAPVIELGKKIEALHAELTEPLEAEANRISSMLGTFQQEQKRLAQEAERKKWEEEQEIIRKANEEAAEKKRAFEAEQAEIKRKADAAQAELDAKAARTRSENGRKKAEEEKRKLEAETAEQLRLSEEKAKAEAEAHRDKVETAIVEKRVEVAAVAHVPVAGIASGDVVEFEITDIHELYAAVPALVKLEPQKAALKAHLKSLRKDQTLPGVKHWWTAKAIVR